MNSKIQNIIPHFAKFEGILPEELIDSKITEELQRARNEINKITDEDLKNIRNLASSQNKAILQSSKPSSVIIMAFYMDGDPPQDDISFYYAHWLMSLSTLKFLAQM